MKSIVWIIISLCPFLAIEDSSHSTLINVGYKNRLMFVRTILNGIFINTNGGQNIIKMKKKRCTMYNENTCHDLVNRSIVYCCLCTHFYSAFVLGSYATFILQIITSEMKTVFTLWSIHFIFEDYDIEWWCQWVLSLWWNTNEWKE